MKHFKLFSLSLIILTSSKFIHAQNPVYNFEVIKGTVLDDSTNHFIPSANFYNESQKNWDNANEKGEFELWVDMSDTLVISAIGYLSEVLIVDSTMLSDTLALYLQPRSYEIGEAIIKAPKTYSKFKQDVLDLELPKTKLDSVAEALAITSKKVIAKAEYDRMVNEVFNREKGTLFVLGAPIKTKKEKQAKALNKVILNEKKQALIDQKFNKEIVQQYTHLEDQELLEFIEFCDFSPEFLIEASEYEIAKQILDKFKQFKNKP